MILFVCTGNTCRSPLAEGLWNAMHGGGAESAGLCSGGGEAAANAITVAAAYGADLSAHRSRPVTPVLLREAQAVVCLSANHLYALSDAVPPEKLYLLGGGIADPYGGDLAAYETVASQIAAALPPLHAAIQAACTVRDTRWEDLAVIAALEADAFSEPRSLPMLELEYAWENNHFLTAEADGKVVGYLSYQTAADEASILDFTVAQDRRGQGIGSKLMARMEASAALQGCLTVWLEVRASNPARKLYRARSYRKAQVRKGMYSKPAEDGIVMALTVQ